ncbi:MAG: sigma-54 interaction domain-containing protein, partial [Ignavibacteriales bacterium]
MHDSISMPSTDWNEYEKILTGFGVGIVVDVTGKILLLNEHYEKGLDIKREDVLGRHVMEVFDDPIFMETIATGEALFTELKGKHDTSQFVTVIPLTENDRVVGAAGVNIFRDMDRVRRFASKISSLTSELAYYKEAVKKLSGARYSLNEIIGDSEVLLEAKDRARRVAGTNAPVLIFGETGTGKELFAHAIHLESSRRDGPLIRVNCASIPESLMESEFFGYEEGAFTGAKKGGKPGKFELANRGSIFLDEIGDLPYLMQPKLLRVLQEKEIERVGGTEIKNVDVRIISATNYDLRKLVTEQKFREDLFYRLNVFQIRVPPLRERLDDIPRLVDHFIRQQNMEYGTRVEGIDREALGVLTSYDWPGNVRELQISIERACLDAQFGLIKLNNLIRFGGRKVSEKRASGLNGSSTTLKEA